MGDVGDDTDERRRNAIKLLEPDLHGLLQVKEVPELYQARLAIQRVRSISRLSSVADDRAAIRTFCTNTLQMNAANDVVDIAALVDAWESSRTRMEVRHKSDAEASLSQLPRPINKIEIQTLAERFATVHGYRLEDKTMPASSTLELVFDQVETGEMKYMSLAQFVCKEDAESEMIGATIEKGTRPSRSKRATESVHRPNTKWCPCLLTSATEVPAEGGLERSDPTALLEVHGLVARRACAGPQGEESSWRSGCHARLLLGAVLRVPDQASDGPTCQRGPSIARGFESRNDRHSDQGKILHHSQHLQPGCGVLISIPQEKPQSRSGSRLEPYQFPERTVQGTQRRRKATGQERWRQVAAP